jgi:hypothetical protein
MHQLDASIVTYVSYRRQPNMQGDSPPYFGFALPRALCSAEQTQSFPVKHTDAAVSFPPALCQLS